MVTSKPKTQCSSWSCSTAPPVDRGVSVYQAGLEVQIDIGHLSILVKEPFAAWGSTRVGTTRVIFEVAGRVQVRHDEQAGYIVFDWSSFTIKLHEIELVHEAALATAQKECCLYYLADTSKVRDVLPQDVIQWWGRIWVPKLSQAGLRAIVTVTPTSALAALSTRSWQAEVIQGITMLNVPTFAQADAAMKRHQAARAH